MNAPSHLKIDLQQLAKHDDAANELLRSVSWQAKKDNENKTTMTVATGREIRTLSGKSAEDSVSLAEIAKEVSGTEVFLTGGINHCLQVVWQAIRLGMHISELYEEYSGLRVLLDLNKAGSLRPDQKGEFQQKQETQSAIALFVAAYYTLWELSNYRRDKVDGIKVDFEGIPQVFLLNSVEAFRCMIFYYTKSVQSEVVEDQYDFIRMTQLYFQGMIDEIRNRLPALKYTEVFTDKKYQLEGTEFQIGGFDAELGAAASRIEFKRITLKDIVGNHPPKHKAFRLRDRLTCYDLATKRNPMMDLGGLPILRSGFGTPGTGKGMHISLTATLLEERCQMIGIPFKYHPMPPDMVSTYQGGSTKKMVEWLAPFRDSNMIVYGPIDDAEQHFQNRTRQNLSEGTQGLMSAFLPAVEGPQAIWYGNAVMELFTNLPEIIDSAVLSRIQDKFEIEGAITWEDFIDQDYLWWERYQRMDPNFIGMEDPKGYRYLDAQKLLRSLDGIYKNVFEPRNGRLDEIFHAVSKKYRPEEHSFFAELYVRVKQVFPLFSSRDVRNIQKAIDERILDFDFPDEWQTKPEAFYLLDYDGKMKLLKQFTLENMKGLSFAQIRLQEVIRYLDTMVLIQEQGKERAIEEAMKQMEIQVAAKERLMAKLKAADGYDEGRNDETAHRK